MSSILTPPRAPPDALRLDSYRVLRRLTLITELRPWLPSSPTDKPDAAFRVLWTCFTFGAPLCVLLNMLTPPYIDVSPSDDLPLARREALFDSFIERIRMLELQGKLGYGELLRREDLFGGSVVGFAKVLKTIKRVLCALEESYPDVYFLPPRSVQQRQTYIQDLFDTEEHHLKDLDIVANATLIVSDTGILEPRLECLLVNRTHLRQYHAQVLLELRKILTAPWLEDWIKIFGIEQPSFVTRTVSAYRSICVNHLPITEFILSETRRLPQDLLLNAQILMDVLPRIPTRLASYAAILRQILDVSDPTEKAYDSLCMADWVLQDAADTLEEMSRHIRDMHYVKVLQKRGVDIPNNSGLLLLDDVLFLLSGASLDQNDYVLFLFENVLVLCMDHGEQDDTETTRYPIYSWELGPALRGAARLEVVQTIRTDSLKTVRVCGSDTGFVLEWIPEIRRRASILDIWKPRPVANELHILEFRSSCADQNLQWCDALGKYAPVIRDELEVHFEGAGLQDMDEVSILSTDSTPLGRRRTFSRPWSVRGHKTTHSESSSLLLHPGDFGSTHCLSPGLLPTLFGKDGMISPLSLDVGKAPPTPPPDFVPIDEQDNLLDLTGAVTRLGRFAEAGGGFSDVWRATWRDGAIDRPVAVKVIRARAMSDPATEEKTKQRLSSELALWKSLHHPHILPLCGLVSDFGRYASMVCPWMENGCVTRYLEMRGDLLGMPDRLQLLAEVALGLGYLHSLGIVHGDLTGSNILITDTGQAVLCDFGLSSLLAELNVMEPSSSLGVGGSVRWADASLYCHKDDTDEQLFLTPPNDIYSFGSVTLELLSGRIPYHYVRSDAQVVLELHRGQKPRRPAATFVTDGQWSFIEHCWDNKVEARPNATEALTSVQALYRASLEFRRHTG